MKLGTFWGEIEDFGREIIENETEMMRLIKRLINLCRRREG